MQAWQCSGCAAGCCAALPHSGQQRTICHVVCRLGRILVIFELVQGLPHLQQQQQQLYNAISQGKYIVLICNLAGPRQHACIKAAGCSSLQRFNVLL